MVAAAQMASALEVISSPALARLAGGLADAAVDRVHEHVGGPEPGAGTVPSVVVTDQPGSLDLLQRHTLPDGVSESVADDRDHVPVLDNVRFVGESTVSRNHVGATFLLLRRHCQLDDAIQRVDDALNTATLRGLYDWERRVDVNVTGDD